MNWCLKKLVKGKIYIEFDMKKISKYKYHTEIWR